MQCMLAGKAPDNLNMLRFPLTGSFKLDGVRVIVLDGVVYSRNMKPIPSQQVQELFGDVQYNGLDGELIAGAPNAKDAFRRTTSAAMARNNPDELVFYVFDDFSEPHLPHTERLKMARKKTKGKKAFGIVSHEPIADIVALRDFEEAALDLGYEGVMIRDPFGAYKFGRSTAREGALLKLKRFEDSEAVIHDCEERMHNANELQQDELGRAKRSSHKEGKQSTDSLGAFVVEDVHNRVKFNVGTGFNEAERKAFWAMREKLVGKVIKYRFFPSGSKDKPRFPTYLGFRDRMDF